MIIKIFHVTLAILTGISFLSRGLARLRSNRPIQAKWLRIVPHIIDTFLLLTAVLLVIQLGYDPLTESWLLVKIVMLLSYVAFGIAMMRANVTYRVRVSLFALALCCYGYIVGVALTRNPYIFF